MFKEYGATEIDFPASPIGEDARVMRGIIKRFRQRGEAGKPTEGVGSSSLSCVRSRLRCASIAARDLPCQQTGADVSVAPYSLNML
jgi:hypothetical protein